MKGRGKDEASIPRRWRNARKNFRGSESREIDGLTTRGRGITVDLITGFCASIHRPPRKIPRDRVHELAAILRPSSPLSGHLIVSERFSRRISRAGGKLSKITFVNDQNHRFS